MADFYTTLNGHERLRWEAQSVRIDKATAMPCKRWPRRFGAIGQHPAGVRPAEKRVARCIADAETAALVVVQIH